MNREIMKDPENAVNFIIIVTCYTHITNSARLSLGKLNNV